MMGTLEFRHNIGEHQNPEMHYPGCRRIERTPSLTVWGDIG